MNVFLSVDGFAFVEPLMVLIAILLIGILVFLQFVLLRKSDFPAPLSVRAVVFKGDEVPEGRCARCGKLLPESEVL